MNHTPNELTNLSFRDIQELKEILEHAHSMIEQGYKPDALCDVEQAINILEDELNENN